MKTIPILPDVGVGLQEPTQLNRSSQKKPMLRNSKKVDRASKMRENDLSVADNPGWCCYGGLELLVTRQHHLTQLLLIGALVIPRAAGTGIATCVLKLSTAFDSSS